MPRAIQMLLFLLVVIGIVVALHGYFWLRLVRDTALPAPWRLRATLAIVALGASLPLSFVASRALPQAVARVVVWPVYVWMGLMLLLLTALAAGEVVRLFSAGVALAARTTDGGALVDGSRRLFLARAVAGGALVLSTGGAAWALHAALGTPGVRDVEVELARLPRSLDGFTVVQLSDLHVGPTLGRDFVREVVDRTNALDPDLVVITGDLVDGSVARLGPAIAPLAGLRARHGVYFVTGNHEYYSGVTAWLPELERLGIRVLRNERVSIGEGEASFDLAGVDDYNARGHAPGHGPDLEKALAGRDPTRALVLLAHQPRQVDEAARHGVGLQLSGHTHGGQIWPWKYFVYLQQPYVDGLHRVGETAVFVMNGTGFWGPPMRLAAPAEIARVVLRAQM